MLIIIGFTIPEMNTFLAGIRKGYPILAIIILLLGNVYSVEAQNPQKADTVMQSTLEIGLAGALIYPGISMGVVHPLSIKQIDKTKKSKSGYRVFRTSSLDVNFATYHHPGFHDNFMLTGGWLMQHIAPNGIILEWEPALGVSRTFLNSTTYTVDPQGGVQQKHGAGFTYAMASIAGGVAYRIPESHWDVGLRLSMIAMYPYNSTFYLRPLATLTARWTPKLWWPKQINLKTKKK